MKLKMYTVHDAKTKAYLPPFYARTRGEAIRMYEQAANDQSHNFHKYASDFTLFELGEFDDEFGSIEMLDVKVSLGLALDFIKGAPASIDLGLHELKT